MESTSPCKKKSKEKDLRGSRFGRSLSIKIPLRWMENSYNNRGYKFI